MKLVLKGPINQSHKPHCQPAPYLTIRNSEQKCAISQIPQCTCLILWDTGQVHCGICEIGALPKQMLTQSQTQICLTRPESTNLPLEKMAAISQTTFAKAFTRVKGFVSWFNFHWSLFLRFQLTIIQCWFRYWLGTDHATSHYLNQGWRISWCICDTKGRYIR